MAFLRRAAPSGATWGEELRRIPAVTDAQGYLGGPWGEYLVAATQYEFATPDWSQDPDYSAQGPAGQVLDFLAESGFGHREVMRGGERLEQETMQALQRDGIGALRAAGPEAWRAATAPFAPSAPPAPGAPLGNSFLAAPAAAAPAPHPGGSRSGSGSSSSSGSGGVDTEQLLTQMGLRLPLPHLCIMNDAVEKATKEVPPEVLSCLPPGLRVLEVKKVSDGWHEGYSLQLSAPLRTQQPPQAILRIWRSQLSYWRVEVPTGSAVELQAMALAQEAGVPTTTCVWPGAAAGVSFAGLCNRTQRGSPPESCDWAIYDFVPHSENPTVPGGQEQFLTGMMARLHSLNLANRDTGALPRFEDWRDHTSYLLGTARQAGYDDTVRAVEAVRALLEAQGVPELPPALIHFDWHLGNALCGADGQMLALIDWEFAGVADPRLDLARHLRRGRWRGDGVCRDKGSDERMWETWQCYATARFGPGADAMRLLGPIEPWLALESAQVLTVGSAICARTKTLQQGYPGTPPLRCDLAEWVEDMETARWHLRRMGLL